MVRGRTLRGLQSAAAFGHAVGLEHARKRLLGAGLQPVDEQCRERVDRQRDHLHDRRRELYAPHRVPEPCPGGRFARQQPVQLAEPRVRDLLRCGGGDEELLHPQRPGHGGFDPPAGGTGVRLDRPGQGYEFGRGVAGRGLHGAARLRRLCAQAGRADFRYADVLLGLVWQQPVAVPHLYGEIGLRRGLRRVRGHGQQLQLGSDRRGLERQRADAAGQQHQGAAAERAVDLAGGSGVVHDQPERRLAGPRAGRLRQRHAAHPDHRRCQRQSADGLQFR